MDSILDFLAENYLIFIIVSAVLLVALIGFIVMSKKKPEALAETPVPGGNPDGQTADTSVIPQPDQTVPETPEVPVTPETPVEATAPVEPVAPVVPEAPVAPAQEITQPAPEQLTPAEQAMNEPTLIINDPSAPVEPAAPQPIVDNQPNDINNQPM